MPLVVNNLKTSIQIFTDQVSPLFNGFPENLVENADKWADAIDTYAKIVVPMSTTSSQAKEAFIKVMQGLSEPFSQISNNIPFTLGYRSPERNLTDFNNYLKKIGYVSNPKLDKAGTITILEKIRVAYNKLYPSRELTFNEIKYNQSRFNEIFKDQIEQGKKKPLQVDGIIGDDTIKYFPDSDSFTYELKGSSKWNQVYSTIKFVTQPRLTGEIDCFEVSNKGSKDFKVNGISSFKFNKLFIETKISKDYNTIILDTTQQKIDGGIFIDLFPSLILKPINFYISYYEETHRRHNEFWKINNINSIDGLVVFYKIKEQVYKKLPEVKRDGLITLQNAIISYSQQIALGMQPAFTGVPPSSPLVLKPVSAVGLAGGSCEECVTLMSTIIDSWFRVGAATNNSSGAVVPWI